MWKDQHIPWACAHCCGSFVAKWVPWSEALLCGTPWWWMVDRVFCESMNGGFDRSAMWRQTHSHSKCLLQGDQMVFPSVMEGVQWNQPDDWLAAGNGAYQRLRFGLCHWQIGHPTMMVATLALVNRSPCCWDHALPPSLSPYPLCFWIPWGITRVVEERDWLVSMEQIISSTWLLKAFCQGYLLMYSHIRYNRYVCMHIFIYLLIHSEKSICIRLPQTSLPSNF